MTSVGKLVEEMGELNQMLGQILQGEKVEGAFKDHLIQEVGDVKAGINLFVEEHRLPKGKVSGRASAKRKKWKKNGVGK